MLLLEYKAYVCSEEYHKRKACVLYCSKLKVGRWSLHSTHATHHMTNTVHTAEGCELAAPPPWGCTTPTLPYSLGSKTYTGSTDVAAAHAAARGSWSCRRRSFLNHTSAGLRPPGTPGGLEPPPPMRFGSCTAMREAAVCRCFQQQLGQHGMLALNDDWGDGEGPKSFDATLYVHTG